MTRPVEDLVRRLDAHIDELERDGAAPNVRMAFDDLCAISAMLTHQAEDIARLKRHRTDMEAFVSDLAETMGLEHPVFIPDDFVAAAVRDRQAICDLQSRAASAEYRAVELEKALVKAEQRLTQALGIIVEFGNLNGFRNLSDEELGRTVLQMATACASTLDEVRAALTSKESSRG